MVKENIEAKKKKILERPMIINNFVEISGGDREDVLVDIAEGRTINRQNAKIFTHQDSDRIYLFKKDGAEFIFGADLFRILSNKQYSSKRISSVYDEDEKDFSIAVKWGKLSKKSVCVDLEDHKEDEIFLSTATEKPEEREFLRGYARMCGVLQVLGETDHNYKNFFVNEKTGTPIKIDHGILMNFFARKPYPVRGSAQSNDFLQASLAGRKKTSVAEELYYEQKPLKHVLNAIDLKIHSTYCQRSMATDQKIIDGLEKRIGELCRKFDQIDEDRSKLFVKHYNMDIGSELFKDIIANVEKNPHLKIYLVEFIEGLKDAIELAKDEDFLDKYVKKYEELDKEIAKFSGSISTLDDQVGDEYYEKAKLQKEFFVQNAKETELQFEYLIKYCDKMKEGMAKESGVKYKNKLPNIAEEEEVFEPDSSVGKLKSGDRVWFDKDGRRNTVV